MIATDAERLRGRGPFRRKTALDPIGLVTAGFTLNCPKWKRAQDGNKDRHDCGPTSATPAHECFALWKRCCQAGALHLCGASAQNIRQQVSAGIDDESGIRRKAMRQI